MSAKAAKKQESSPAVTCILCKAPLEESTARGLLLHEETKLCEVRITDKFGISLDDKYEIIDGEIYERQLPLFPNDPIASKPTLLWDADEPKKEEKALKLEDFKIHLPIAGGKGSSLIEIPTFKNHEEAINSLFEEHGQDKLGGASGDLGWSSFYSFQRCPYLWKRSYLDGFRFKDEVPNALIIGSLLHLFLALRYQTWIDLTYSINPDIAYAYLSTQGINPEALREAWRIYDAYRAEYEGEQAYMLPQAVEYHTVDPRTKESCRYDMIAKVDGTKTPPGMSLKSGTYVVEHKTTSRRDDSSLTGWVNDGEIIGQVMLYDRLKLYKRFGPLQGVIINLCGKQKKPAFDRVQVSPVRWQKNQHAKDLKVWQAFRELCVAQGSFPRSRANCINRWGKCSQWDHCAGSEEKDE